MSLEKSYLRQMGLFEVGKFAKKPYFSQFCRRSKRAAPFADQPQDASVFNPPLNHLHEFLSHHGVERSGDVGLQDPPDRSPTDDPPDPIECSLLAPSGANPG